MRTLDKLPAFLQEYCSEQDMNKYTARNHAVWRYIMRRALPFFRKHAVDVYEDGLTKTGLPLDRVPNIDYMDKVLQDMGWGAVPVCGFIPPWAFLEFQARKILPIATDIRSADHIGYTPAPDIVHEAAGHAPILPDVGYAKYLEKYGQLCTKAIYSQDDTRIFEAIRYLSDIKEKPESSTEDIERAENNLKDAVSKYTYVSEQTRVARMSWWTNEYGLVGSLKDPKIYGAGLLSSVTESKNIYTANVKKVRLSIDCINQGYDITKPQPQLFVAEDMQHLISVLGKLDETLAYRKGGTYAVDLGKESGAITTTVLDSGLEISGILTESEADKDSIEFLKWSGPVQLCLNGSQLKDQGVERHPEGFSTPLGRLASFPEKSVSQMTKTEWERAGLKKGPCELEFSTGFILKAELLEVVENPKTGLPIYGTFTNCLLTKNGKTYYHPDWGLFDMPFGESVSSVYGGPSDRINYGYSELSEITTVPGRETPFTTEELTLFKGYQRLRDLRDSGMTEKELMTLAETGIRDYPNEWLYLLEIYEAGRDHLRLAKETPWLTQLFQHISSLTKQQDQADLISVGLDLIGS